ncbi:MAG: response regulator [Thermodesulfobacteriota bacterium]|nr:response regulator [Thermodesulfobacteriota bacterium]
MRGMMDVSGSTLLVVDDSPLSSMVVSLILKKHSDYYTVSVWDGPACIKKAKEIKPDLILLDIQMPGMNGIEVCKVLRNDEQTSEIPVIFVTSSTDNETLKEAFEAGGNDYVRKPVNKTELLARIKSVLLHKKMEKKFMEEEKFNGVLEMAGGICHELNQPMQVVSGYSELLLMDMGKENSAYPYIKMIKEQTDKMGSITRKLMRITKYETQDYIEGSRIVDIDKASNAAG